MRTIDARGVAKATGKRPLGRERTNAFGAHRAPEYHGSDDIRVANRNLARRARTAERAWRRSLKGA